MAQQELDDFAAVQAMLIEHLSNASPAMGLFKDLYRAVRNLELDAIRAALNKGAPMTMPDAADLQLDDLEPPLLARGVLVPKPQPGDEGPEDMMTHADDLDDDATDALRAQALQILIDHGLFNGEESINSALFTATASGRGPAVMQSLLKAGGLATCRDKKQRTLLHFVRRRDVAAMLIAAGVDASGAGADGLTPLHALAYDAPKQAGLVKLLVDAGANVDAVTEEGRSPLVFAATCCMDPKAYAFIMELLRAGADATLTDIKGLFPRQYAMSAFEKRKEEQEEEEMDLVEGMSSMAVICTLELEERWRRRRHMLLAIRGRR